MFHRKWDFLAELKSKLFQNLDFPKYSQSPDRHLDVLQNPVSKKYVYAWVPHHGKVHSLYSEQVEADLCAAWHASTLHVHALGGGGGGGGGTGKALCFSWLKFLFVCFSFLAGDF